MYRNKDTQRMAYAHRDMLRRCYDPANKSFKNYGARGIAVCDRWRESFAAFVEDMGVCPKGLTLDRIDNDAGYSKENCRWATWSEQNRNQRPRVHPNSTFGTGRGVSRVKRNGRFKAYIPAFNGGVRRQIHLGMFATEEAAREAVLRARGQEKSA